MGIFESAWVIARRDFLATVYSRAFILFMLTPILVFGISIFFAASQGRADREATQSRVALLLDRADVEALNAARADLVGGTSELAFPALVAVQPESDTDAQARRLLAGGEEAFSGVVSGTLDQPVLTGPQRAGDAFGGELSLIVEQARTDRALAARPVAPAEFRRVVTESAAGSQRGSRHLLARMSQLIVFMLTMMLATMLVSNFIEEKSNKIIEVLAAAAPLDAIFLGKLLATLAVSIVGLCVWGGLAGLIFLVFSQGMPAIAIGPAIGWAAFLMLLPFYFAANFLLFGAVFLGVGAQANSVKEVQSISLPIVMAQLAVLLLAGTTVSGPTDSWLTWLAYVFPLSSPMAMAAFASQSDLIWPHLLALAWQALWVFLSIRIAANLFRRFVMKSSAPAAAGKAKRFGLF